VKNWERGKKNNGHVPGDVITEHESKGGSEEALK